MEIQSDDNSAAAHSDHPVVGMDAALKAKWVEALRSGVYTQAFGNIGLGRHLCCIGVGGTVAGYSQEVGKHWLSYSVARRLGISDELTNDLVRLNDTERKSFHSIASWIETNIPARPNGDPPAPVSSA